MNSWIFLILAGLFEVIFTTCMELSEGFSKIPYTIGLLVASLFSLYFLSKSLIDIPLGTAYAVWTGIGALGTVLVGILFFGDPSSFLRVFFLITLVLSIIGLKYVTGN